MKVRELTRLVLLLARIGLGVLFIYMGLTKALHPELFLKLVHAYDLITNPYLLNGIAAVLPWFEVLCGVLLVFGVAVRGTAVVAVTMLVPFTALILWRAMGIAAHSGISLCSVKFDCGCGAGEVFACNKLIENTVLIFISGTLIGGGGYIAALRYQLFSAKSSDKVEAQNQESST